jgi:hypothetical protein
MYRKNWFYGSADQRVGPEFSLIGNNKIMWTTASKEKKNERQGMLGITKWVNWM